MTPLPAEPPVGGVLWSVVVPALVLLVTCAATYLLYRHFAGQHTGSPPRGRTRATPTSDAPASR